MAKATAHCTCKTCGATFYKSTVKSSRSQADRWEEWAIGYYDECPNCYHERIEMEREKEEKLASEVADEMELAELKGSDKQVAWALRIRKAFIEDMEKEFEQLTKILEKKKAKGSSSLERAEESYNEITRTYDFILSNKDSASWWIDRRNDSARSIINQNAGKVPVVDDRDASEIVKEAVEEATIAPENRTHSGAVTITVKDAVVSARYQKDDDFRTVVKSLGYRWSSDDRAWNKWMSVTTGAASDRAAELASKLLNAGFAVVLMDKEIARRAIEADYKPECHRWVVLSKGELVIKTEKNDPVNRDVYKLGARWSNAAGGCVVDKKLWREVLDFAEINGFKLSEGAEREIDMKRRSEIIVAPKKQEEKKPTDGSSRLGEILASPTGLLDDLVDE